MSAPCVKTTREEEEPESPIVQPPLPPSATRGEDREPFPRVMSDASTGSNQGGVEVTVAGTRIKFVGKAASVVAVVVIVITTVGAVVLAKFL